MSVENSLQQQNQLLKSYLGKLPSRHEEDWRYVDFKFFQQNSYSIDLESRENTLQRIEAEKKILIHIRNTQADAEMKMEGPLPPGLSIGFVTNEEGLLKESIHFFSSLNSELSHKQSLQMTIGKDFDSQYLIEIILHPRETRIDHPLFSNKSFYVKLAEGASAHILERSYLNQKQFVNLSCQYQLAAGSQLSLLKIEKGQMDGRGCQNNFYTLNTDATLSVTTATLGGDWSRHNTKAQLIGEGAKADFYAAYVTQNKEFVDHHTEIIHNVGNTQSLQQYSGVLNDSSHAVFNGKVHIMRDAQKSSAQQSNKNLLLSAQAKVDTKPELMIDADDVQAKHGATVGQLNPDEVFYLKSRGIDEKTARTMLTKSFVKEIGAGLPARLQKIFDEDLEQHMNSMVVQ